MFFFVIYSRATLQKKNPAYAPVSISWCFFPTTTSLIILLVSSARLFCSFKLRQLSQDSGRAIYIKACLVFLASKSLQTSETSCGSDIGKDVASPKVRDWEGGCYILPTPNIKIDDKKIISCKTVLFQNNFS